ncbi:hypothetical protein BSR09_11755 [Stutzerimonas degradans]|nr:hypothetical protein BSR09_11755 [Stutzerimonas degradans]
MTAAELIAILQGYPGDTPVLVEGHGKGWDAIRGAGTATVVEVVEPAEPDGRFCSAAVASRGTEALRPRSPYRWRSAWPLRTRRYR